MLTIFTITKSFTDEHIARIQRNAFGAWKHMQPAPQVIVFGDAPGTRETCEAFDFLHVPTIRRNAVGLECVSDAFEQAWRIGQYDTMCYINADMILPPTFPYVVASIDAETFLMVGQRHNTPIDFDLTYESGWWARLKAHAETHGHRHTPHGIDYFVHRRGAFDPLPELLVGRWYWDNYMIWRAQHDGVPVIDATEAVLAIHQDHEYSHFPGGLGALGNGEESMSNKQHLPDNVVPTIANADMKLLPAF